MNRLYAEFSYLKDINIIFISNGNVIDITASFQKNKIRNDSIILIVEIEKIILLHFISTDQRVNIDLDIACTSSDYFEIILERLYKEFPYLKSKTIYFLMNGTVINKNATLEKNKIKDNCNILIDIMDDWF